MPMWRCPHCGTPQAETARCWVCHRSSTACASCRHFRRSVAAQVGYCGLDRERRPLRGDEIRACWEARAETPEAPASGIPRSAPTPATFVEDRTPVRRLEFVEVGVSAGRPSRKPAGGAVAVEDDIPAEAATLLEPGPPETRWSLWGDAEG
jgi:hypothetical protein